MPTRPVTVSTVPEVVLPYNNQRTTASLVNEGATTVFVSEDETSIVANGFPIAAGGALDLIRALGDEPQNTLFIQSAAGGEDVRVLEAFGALPELRFPGVVEQRRVGVLGEREA